MDDRTRGGSLARLLEEARKDDTVMAVLLCGRRAKEEHTPRSDHDSCLVLAPVGYREPELSEKRLQYLQSFDLDVQVFPQLPLSIRTRMLREGHIPFSRDEEALYDVAHRTAQRFEDYRHLYKGCLEEVASTSSPCVK